jgi:acetaldehyde dehydrogenase (acetylating)
LAFGQSAELIVARQAFWPTFGEHFATLESSLFNRNHAMDRDLASIQEVRDMLAQAREAVNQFKHFTQDQVDRVIQAMGQAAQNNAKRLARMAHEETGFGRTEDKTTKNLFASKNLVDYVSTVKTCGVVNYDESRRIHEIAVPMGVVAGLIPCTNPTSTVIFKSIISLKGRNAIVMSPHPKARGSILEATRILADAAASVGAPRHLIQCMTIPTLEGTSELMKHRDTSVILATGGSDMVRAAYSAGKPAYGVGPGNVPAYVDRTADVGKAAADIIAGKSFDWGTVCASEQSVVADRPIAGRLMEELKRNGAYFATSEEKAKLQAVMVDKRGKLNPAIVGRSPQYIGELAGLKIQPNVRALVVMLDKVGPEDPLSCEKLSPVLGFYVVDGWKKGCDLSVELLAYGGVGHTFAIHCNDPDVVMEFGLHKPAFRIIVNSSSTHGAIGYTTGLVPSLTLGPGTWGGSITSDNVGPLHLVNIKRIAWELNPLAGKSSGDTKRWAYDEDFRYRPKSDTQEPPAEAPKGQSYGKSGLSDQDIERIVKEFNR